MFSNILQKYTFYANDFFLNTFNTVTLPILRCHYDAYSIRTPDMGFCYELNKNIDNLLSERTNKLKESIFIPIILRNKIPESVLQRIITVIIVLYKYTYHKIHTYTQYIISVARHKVIFGHSVLRTFFKFVFIRTPYRRPPTERTVCILARRLGVCYFSQVKYWLKNFWHTKVRS